jgi:hypothetical protein
MGDGTAFVTLANLRNRIRVVSECSRTASGQGEVGLGDSGVAAGYGCR